MARKEPVLKKAELAARKKFLAKLPKALTTESDCEKHDGLVAAALLGGVLPASMAELLFKRSSQALRGMRQRGSRSELDELRALLAEITKIETDAAGRGAAERDKTG